MRHSLKMVRVVTKILIFLVYACNYYVGIEELKRAI